ncbi:MAG: endolytic transglycosylase MltG [bacterium]
MLKRIFFIILIILIAGYLWVSNQASGFSNGQDKIFIIEKGQGVNEISANLKKEGFIKNCLIFETYVWGKKAETKFKTGEYILNTGVNMAEIAEKLTEGYALSQEREIKIIEGWNVRDIADYLEKEEIARKDDFLDIVETWQALEWAKTYKLEFLSQIPEGKNLEGFLFPDTYRIYKNATAQDIAGKMATNFGVKVDDNIMADIKKQGKSLYEIIIMASIIEKEVTGVDDMKKVSDIFWRRIESGISLQSCATIAYVLGENKPQYSYEDTRVDSLYNTYINRGLPPGPICNPGIRAIKAAIYPEKNEYWYFLSKQDGSKETVFSKTLDEHNFNKEKYLK